MQGREQIAESQGRKVTRPRDRACGLQASLAGTAVRDFLIPQVLLSTHQICTERKQRDLPTLSHTWHQVTIRSCLLQRLSSWEHTFPLE